MENLGDQEAHPDISTRLTPPQCQTSYPEHTKPKVAKVK